MSSKIFRIILIVILFSLCITQIALGLKHLDGMLLTMAWIVNIILSSLLTCSMCAAGSVAVREEELGGFVSLGLVNTLYYLAMLGSDKFLESAKLVNPWLIIATSIILILTSFINKN